MNLHAKMAMPDFRRFSWNLILIKNVEDTVVYPTQKVFISGSFFIACYKQKMAKSLSPKTVKKTWILIYAW